MSGGVWSSPYSQSAAVQSSAVPHAPSGSAHASALCPDDAASPADDEQPPRPAAIAAPPIANMNVVLRRIFAVIIVVVLPCTTKEQRVYRASLRTHLPDNDHIRAARCTSARR